MKLAILEYGIRRREEWGCQIGKLAMMTRSDKVTIHRDRIIRFELSTWPDNKTLFTASDVHVKS